MGSWENIKKNAKGQMDKLFGYGASAVEGVDEGLVLGEGKVSDIGKEPSEFMALFNEATGKTDGQQALSKSLREGDDESGY